MLIVQQTPCPNCGAPLALREGQRHVICAYCNTSASVAFGAPPAAHAAAGTAAQTVQLTPERVSKEDVERIKQLVLDGKRADAVAHYERVASVPHVEAEVAVDQISLGSVFALTARTPINAFGCLLHAVFIGVGVAAMAWGIAAIVGGEGAWPAFVVLVLAGAAWALWRIVRLVPKLVSSAVAKFGASGRGRVLKCAALRPIGQRGVIALVSFEVQPDAGGAPFLDEEVMGVGTSSLAKLEPGNIVPVRFDSARTRVFPITPITVVGRAGGGYRG